MSVNLVAYCASELGVSPQVIRRIGLQAPHKYKRFKIRKRSGGEYRDVAQPAREVKALQRALVSFLKSSCQIHEAATAYVSGGSIAKNAQPHLGSRYLLKLDFTKFFDSIDIDDVVEFLSNTLGDRASKSEVELAARAFCWQSSPGTKLALCIGAPSSPFLSNAIMAPFDRVIASECEARKVTYTRYSDDMTFGALHREALIDVERLVVEMCSGMTHPTLRLNPEKRVLVGRASRLWVTGVCLSTQGELTVGRVRKRGIRAGVKRFLNGELSEAAILKLRGEIAFASSVETQFLDRLYDWYGSRVSLLLSKKGREAK